MTENWKRVQTLFLKALDLHPEERAAFLQAACTGDEELRGEIESLLSQDAASDRHIEAALAGTAHSFFESKSIKPGTKIQDYEVLTFIGAGGMGEVYQARDLRLARNVAIKVLPSFLTNDPDRLRRFEREAQAAAALNHPNILAVHQLGFFEGAPYLVSELLEGKTLRELIRGGALPWRNAIEYGVQIVRGLAAAHGKGITHRDLKPENLFVTKDGHVKILDFGLAKLSDPPSSGHSGAGTAVGLVMGTVGYMSPEQLRGEEADYRADFFAFGAILYEMLCGQRAFRKPTAADTMSAILNEDPPSISQLLPTIPPALQRMVHRCLEKNREQRFQSASDLAFALESLTDSAIYAVPAAGTGRRHRPSPAWLAPIMAVTACVVLGLAYWFRPTTPLLRISSIVKLTESGGARRGEPLFTDGPRVYYQSIGPLGKDWQLRQVLLNGDRDTPVDIPAGPFHIRGLSPDDTEFVAILDLGEQSTVWRMPVAGGSPRRVGNLVADDIARSHDDSSFAYTRGNQLLLAKADGTSSRVLMTVPETGVRIEHIRWSPDDRRLRFTFVVAGDVGSLVNPTKQSLWEIGADGRDLHELRFNWPGNAIECCGEWTPDGRYFVFESDRGGSANLWALEEKSDWWRRPNADPVQLTSGPMNYYEPTPSRNGKNIFAIGVQPSGELVRYDPGRKDFVPFLGGRSLAHLAFSHDGGWVAYVAYPEGTLWRARSDGTEPLQLTFPPLQVGAPTWSADGKWIAFHGVQRGQDWTSFVISAEGGNPEPFSSDPLSQVHPGWIPGRDALTYSRNYRADSPALYVFDRRSGRSEKIPGTEGLYGLIWSPDGRYTLATDAATDRLLLFDLKSGKRTPIAGPMAWPRWSPDSQYIYFVRWGINSILRVDVPDGREEKVLEVPFRVAPWPFAVAPDGSLLLLREYGRYDVYSLSVSVR
jgi:serine/threonine protein kinase/Tol biopolymer transport system component